MKKYKKNFFGDIIYSPFEVVSDGNLANILRPVFIKLCFELGITNSQASEFADLIWADRKFFTQSHFEKYLRSHFNKMVSGKELIYALEKRAKIIVKQVQPFIKGDTIADIGCGDGLVSWFLRKNVDHIFLTDMNFYLDQRVHLPFYQYKEGCNFNLTVKADTSFLITVLHHSVNPMYLLQQVKKITRSRLLVIESVIGVEKHRRSPKSYLYNLDFDQQRKYAIFFDWLYNRILHKDVPVPYNYLTISQWRKVFEDYKWNVSEIIDLGVDQNLVPEHHVLFVLDC